MKSKAMCPKCRSKDIFISEYAITYIEWNQKNGEIEDEGIQNPGEIIKVTGTCRKCKHYWTFRKIKDIYILIEEGINYE